MIRCRAKVPVVSLVDPHRARILHLSVLAIAAVALVVMSAARARACNLVPLPGCRTAGLSSLQIQRNVASGGKDRLRWQWKNGQATLQPGFGTPTTATTHALCLYDERGLVESATIPPSGTCGGRSCWEGRQDKGFTYKDKAALHDGVQRLTLDASAADQAKIRLDGKGEALPDAPLPLIGTVVAQLVNDQSGVCFESTFASETIRHNDAARFTAKSTRADGPSVAPLPSLGCGTPVTRYATGANPDSQEHDGLARTYGVYLAPSYDLSGIVPAPLLLVFHGGFGSGDQVFASARMMDLADAEGIVVVSPDGVLSPGGIRTWNAGGCCGYAVSQDIDDVGFVAALLDRLGESLCFDLRRVYATGISNGAMLSYRLGCELSARIAAIGPVAGSAMTASCAATRPVPVMAVHGSADMNVPWEGGLGCGPAGVPYVSVEDSIGGWIKRNACTGPTVTYSDEGDGHCERRGISPSGADVVLCTIAAGGHSWPGGTPPASQGFPGCPFGAQSTTFSATRHLYDFFGQHPLR
jgi:polyhydroxybutyrate depolymerase